MSRFLKLAHEWKPQPISFSRIVRHIVSSFLVDRARIKEMFVQMIHIFEHVALHSPRDGNIIDQASM